MSDTLLLPVGHAMSTVRRRPGRSALSHSKLNSAVQNQPREKYATLVLTELPFGAAAAAEARAVASMRVDHMLVIRSRDR